MIGTLEKTPQLDIFREPLRHILREDDELVHLAESIEWDRIISSLSIHYSPDKGRRAIPIRKLSGILILKKIYGGSDESILRQYTGNPSFQHFCGEVYPRNRPPASRSDLVKFRSRIGKKGMEAIFYPELNNYIVQMSKKREAESDSYHSVWNFSHFLKRIFRIEA
ncbi:MAG: transposase [bacterium]